MPVGLCCPLPVLFDSRILLGEALPSPPERTEEGEQAFAWSIGTWGWDSCFHQAGPSTDPAPPFPGCPGEPPTLPTSKATMTVTRRLPEGAAAATTCTLAAARQEDAGAPVPLIALPPLHSPLMGVPPLPSSAPPPHSRPSCTLMSAQLSPIQCPFPPRPPRTPSRTLDERSPVSPPGKGAGPTVVMHALPPPPPAHLNVCTLPPPPPLLT